MIILFFIVTGGFFLWQQHSEKILDVIDAYGNGKGKGGCIYTTSCNSMSPIECAQDWLINSGCFSQEYIDKHFQNFRIDSDESPKQFITFDFIIDGHNVCKSGYPACGVVMYEDDDKLEVRTVYGPLQEYDVSIRKEQAIEILKGNEDCSEFSEIYLTVWDQFRGQGGEGFVGYGYDRNGLHWRTFSGGLMCGRSCYVNAMSGKLKKGNYSCI